MPLIPARPQETSRIIWVLVALFLFALAVRVGAAARFVGIDTPPREEAGGLDVIDYEQFAYSMSAGHGYALKNGQPSARRAPGTSLALLPVYFLFGRNYAAAHLWFCVLSSLTCVAAACVAGISFGPKKGAATGLLLSVYPGSFYYSMHFFSEVPFTLWLTLACGFSACAVLKSRVVWSLLAGVFLGLATLTRPQIALVMPIAWILSLLMRGLRNRWSLYGLVLQSVAMAAVLAPWLMRNKILFGKATLATVVSGVTFFGANNEFVATNPEYLGRWYFGQEVIGRVDWPASQTELEMDTNGWRFGKQFIRTHYSQIPGLITAKLWRLVDPFPHTPNRAVYWAFALAWLAVAPAFVIGILIGWRSRREITALHCLPLLAMVLSTIVFYGDARMRDSVAPIVLLFAGVGLVGVWRRLKPVLQPAPQSRLES